MTVFSYKVLDFFLAVTGFQNNELIPSYPLMTERFFSLSVFMLYAFMDLNVFNAFQSFVSVVRIQTVSHLWPEGASSS